VKGEGRLTFPPQSTDRLYENTTVHWMAFIDIQIGNSGPSWPCSDEQRGI
jgi:hypothetical protein